MSGVDWSRWSFEPMVVGGLAVSALWYGAGVRGLRAHGAASFRAVGRANIAAFLGGLGAVAVALVSPVDAAAGWSLSWHMVQHLLLILVAAPLLVLGRPLTPFTVVLPPEWRRWLKRAGRRRAASWAWRMLTTPVVAWAVHISVLWAWHAPGPYDAAAANVWVHVLEHAGLLGTGVLFWWVAFQPGPARARRLPRGADVLYVLTAWMATGALGALFTFATSPLYPLYVRLSAAHGINPLHDQQIAGLLMWIPAGTVYLVMTGFFFVAWLRTMEVEMRRQEAQAEPALPNAPAGVPVRP